MTRVLVLGDIMRDIVVRPSGPPRRGTDRAATIRTMPGGAGGNLAAWLAHCGVPTRLLACVAEADVATESSRLRGLGVEPVLVGHASLPTGTLIATIDPDGERSFLTDRGANDALRPADIADALFADVGHVHISGYAFVGSATATAAVALIAQARARGLPLSVDPGSAGFLVDMGPATILHAVAGAALCVANQAEAAVLTGFDAPEEQAAALAARFDLVLLKMGAEGALACGDDMRALREPAPSVAVVDTIGAGDAFLAGFLAARLAGRPISVALSEAVALGAVAVAREGGTPPG